MTPTDYPDESTTGPGAAAIAQVETPAWGPNYGSTTVEPPDMPAHAAYISQDVLDGVAMEKQANDWAGQHLQNLAEQWAQNAWQATQQAVQNFVENPGAAMDALQGAVQGQLNQNADQAQAAAASVVPPQVQGAMENAQIVAPGQQLPLAPQIQQTTQNLAQAAGDVASLNAPAAIRDIAANPLEPLANVRPGFNSPEAAGPTSISLGDVGNAALTPFMGGQAAEAAPGMAAKVAPKLPGRLGDLASQLVLKARGAPEMAGAALDADHPIVQQAADAMGAKAERVAAALNDSKRMAKILGSKNPERDLSKAEQAALAITKATGASANPAQATNIAKTAGLPNPFQETEAAQAAPVARKAATAATESAGNPAISGALSPEEYAKTPLPTGEAAAAKPPITPVPESPEMAAAFEGGPQAPAPLEASAPAGKTPPPPVPTSTKVLNTVNNLQGIMKQAVLAGQIFHPAIESAQLGRTALAAGRPLAGAKAILDANRAFLQTGFAKQYAADNADVIERAMQHGATLMKVEGLNPDLQMAGNNITKQIFGPTGIARTLFGGVGGGVSGYASAKAQGQSNEEALGRAGKSALAGAALGAIAPLVNTRLWGNFVPVAKTEAYKMLEPLYGSDVAAKRINDTFGGQNLVKLGRDPDVQKYARALLLAPDWLESWARNLGATIKPGPEGDAARKFWAATAVSGFLTTEGISQAINGRYTWQGPDGQTDMGHALRVDVSKLFGQPAGSVYADTGFLGPVGSAANALIHGHPEEIVTSHLNVIPSMAYGAMTNDAFPSGQGKIVQPGTPASAAALPEAAAAAGHLAPIGVGTMNKQIPTGAKVMSELSGMNIQPGTKASMEAGQGGRTTASRTAPRGTNLSKLSSFLNPKVNTNSRSGARGGLSSLKGLGG